MNLLKLNNYQKKVIVILLQVLVSAWSFTQSDYFQQEVNYKIDVTLNDTTHYIKGIAEIEYVNNSPDVLDKIYFHLWANAYKNVNTAFAKQQVRMRDVDFYFTEEKNRGGYEEIDFYVEGKKMQWHFDENNPDIALVTLPVPLKSGEKVNFSIPFSIKIPNPFSRLNHKKQNYNMTQWYPKPAVYDKTGWHQMPYLDMGEFYSEFGSFDVKITLPENYIVASTGTLQTKSEVDFLNKKIEETDVIIEETENAGFLKTDSKKETPKSSSKLKTLHYTAENVHDFAWFASKDFLVQKSSVRVSSDRKVSTWAFFPEEQIKYWKDATKYVSWAVRHYSSLVGEYPYPQAAAVYGSTTGGGMEYPMITIIGNTGSTKGLDNVITHEVGHNWFYGILASNERDNPWMDEGMNSYYENRYMVEHYGDEDSTFPDFITKKSDYSMEELGYFMQAREKVDQPCETSSNDFALINYWLSAYQKPASIFEHLENYLGTKELDRIIQIYYKKWEFKHPKPDDLRKLFEKETGKDLSWFFDGLIFSNDKIDYSISKVKKTDTGFQIDIKNKGQIAAPFPIDGVKDDSIVKTVWYEGIAGKQTVNFPKGDYDMIVLDEDHLILDINKGNNFYKTSGIFKTCATPQLTIIPVFENSKRTMVNYSPAVAFNTYDGAMVGLALFNIPIPAHKIDFAVVPMYGFKSKNLTGIGNIRANFFLQSSFLQHISAGFSAKSFNFRYNEKDDYNLKYARFMPYLEFKFRKNPTSKFHQSIVLKSKIINSEIAQYDTTGFTGKEWGNTTVYELALKGKNKRAINPFGYELKIEQQQYQYALKTQNYLKVSLEFITSYTYDKKRSVDFRFFMGMHPVNTKRDGGNIFPGAFYLTSEGYSDYSYDEYFFGRNEQDGIWSQLVSIKDGGFKNAFGSSYRTSSGATNNFMLSVNVKGDLPKDLPLKLPVKPYFDFAYSDNAQPAFGEQTWKDNLWWSGGFMLDFKIVSIYFPVINSENLKILYNQRNEGKYLSRITFSFDLNRLDLWRLKENFNFQGL